MTFSRLLLLGRVLGVSGLGTLTGLAVGGLVTVATGQAFAADSIWPTALPGLLLLGAGLGALASRGSRRWLFPVPADKPQARRRLLLFILAGTLLVPLAVAVGESRGIGPLVLAPAVVCWAATLAIWVRYVRRGQRNIRRAVLLDAATR